MSIYKKIRQQPENFQLSPTTHPHEQNSSVFSVKIKHKVLCEECLTKRNVISPSRRKPISGKRSEPSSDFNASTIGEKSRKSIFE